MRTQKITIILLHLAVLATSAPGQRTLRIPADQPTIQSAIDIAVAGDTVLVAPGTYFENLNLHGKAITVASAEGPSVTILDGRSLSPTVSFTTGESRATTLSGFTIRNGAPLDPTHHGGGILLVTASPTITGNIFTQNICAAVGATDSSPLLSHNVIRATTTSPLCEVQPIAPVVFNGGSPELVHNLVEQNDLSAADAIAGGIAILNAHATLQANIIRNNRTANAAPSALSAVSLRQSILFEQNLIYANISRCTSAVELRAPGQFLNNTVADNPSHPSCSAVQLAVADNVILLANNIVATPSAHPALACDGPSAFFQHNLIHNASGPATTGSCPTLQIADPLFADREHADYHLSPDSPARNEGATNLLLPLRDLDDIPRTQNGFIDLGPYQHAQPNAFVATTTSLNAMPNPAEAFQSITLSALVTAQNAIPSGSITFTANAQTLASIPLDATGHAAFTTTTLPAGSYPVTATYSGSNILSSSSSPLTVHIAPATTLLSFAVTPSTADETQTVTLSAIVEAPLSTQPPTGQVQFTELTTKKVLATVPLDATGHATTTLSSMSAGSWLVTAAFLGSPNFAPATLPGSNALILTIANRGYTLTGASTVTVASGHHVPVALNLASVGTFAATISLSCSGLPANASCGFSPALPSLIPGGNVPVTLTVETNAVPGFLSMARPFSGPALALMPLLLLVSRRRRRGLALCLLAGLTGCTSKYPAQVPSGTYQIQVVSQAPGSVSKHVLPITLIVTN